MIKSAFLKVSGLLVIILILSSCTPPPKVDSAIGKRIEELGAVSPADQALYQAVLAAQALPFHAGDAATILRGIQWDNQAAPTSLIPEYKPGDTRQFWVHNNDTFESLQIEARLVHISDHAYFWLDTGANPVKENGQPVTEADWLEAGESFDQSYDAVRAVFGNEPSPGLDGDPRLYIIHSDKLGNVGGYFGDSDQFPVSVEQHSNQGEYFYVSTTGAGDIPGDYYKLTLAHEFQHMIQNSNDGNEDGWMNEAFSTLAQQVAGMQGDTALGSYLQKLDQSLWYWAGDSSDYGHAYLFIDYLYEQVGMDFIKTLSTDPVNGLTSIDVVLAQRGAERAADDYYADYMLALYFNQPTLGDGRYAFKEANIPFQPLTNNLSLTSFPATYSSDVNQYGGIDILRFEGKRRVTLTFTGAQTVRLVNTDAHSGERMWWSNRADGSMSALTRSFDLSNVSQATLKYWTWYDLEKEWDYGYLMVSTDEGQTWTNLTTPSSVTTNPNGNNYGYGFTGASGGGDSPIWVQESVDLSPYAGKVIQLRFATITDTVLNDPGLVVDDIEISEIGFQDDAEKDDGQWIADGFVLIHNRVPQLWRVRVALESKDGRIDLHDLNLVDGSSTMEINFQDIKSVIVFITALTRQTSETAPYRITFDRP
ncbi:MAG: immune inhibitor A [Anaerolineales bacterium]|nr:immune inhibitor A [Anaerolineales bacterium]